MENNKVNFGFNEVDATEKAGLVHSVFSKVAGNYDLMNDLMSFGIHRIWKNILCSKIYDYNGNILDAACGSGDLSFNIYKIAHKQRKSPKITMLDINQNMLEQAKNRAYDSNILDNIEFICADMENLPISDNTFDYYIIGFGIRNVTNIDKALSEVYRTLKPGGKFLCLEFSKLINQHMQNLYNIYAFNVIPQIGKIVANNKAAYEYLVQSIELFPDQEKFKSMIQNAGLDMVNYQNLSCGVATIYSAYKL